MTRARYTQVSLDSTPYYHGSRGSGVRSEWHLLKSKPFLLLT